MVSFTAVHRSKQYAGRVLASPEKIFPLLCPVRELEWLGGWECELLHSRSGVNEEGCVFLTHKPYGRETVWYTTRFDLPGRVVEFVQFARDLVAVRFRITLHPVEPEVTEVVMDYDFTALSEEGDRFLEQYTDEQFIPQRAWVLRSLQQYLATSGSSPEL